MPAASLPSPSDDDLAELADRIVNISRSLTAPGLVDARIVPLSPLESLVIRYVHRNPRATPSQVAAHVRLHSSNASTVVRELVKKGLLERTPDAQDRRTAHLTLTAEALDSVARLRAEWSRRLRAALPEATRLDAVLEAVAHLDDALGGA